MTAVKYFGEFPEGQDEIEQHGYVFGRGKSVDVTDKQYLAKLRANRFFEVDGKSDDDAHDEAEAAEEQTLRAYLKDENVPAHHKLKLPALRKLKADHEEAKAKALEA